jgi:hypothetical protein
MKKHGLKLLWLVFTIGIATEMINFIERNNELIFNSRMEQVQQANMLIVGLILFGLYFIYLLFKDEKDPF